MSDFIHEQPVDPEQKTEVPAEKPKSAHERQKKVYGYALILFAAAFVLILWSFLMQHRSNQEVLSEVKASSLFLKSTLEENDGLESRIAALETRLRDAEAENETLSASLADAQKHEQELESELTGTKDELDAAKERNTMFEEAGVKATATICAMDWLREIEREYAAKRYSKARTLIEGFEDNDLAQYLPFDAQHTDPDGSDAVAPAESYQAIVKALFPNGVPKA